MFEQVILDNSGVPISKLWGKSLKASQTPLTGIDKISNKSVEYVIRDCAKVARLYLPIMMYGTYKNPIENLKGKFTKKDILDIVGRAEKQTEVRQLLKLVLSSIQKHNIDQQLKTDDLVSDHETKDPIPEPDDIYGEYGNVPEVEPEEVVEVVDLNNLSSKELANFLIKTFKAK